MAAERADDGSALLLSRVRRSIVDELSALPRLAVEGRPTRDRGLTATELHSTAKAEVDARIARASAELAREGAEVILLGCAGMSGMEAAVRAGAASTSKGQEVVVVDGVRAGIVLLEDMVRAQSADARKEEIENGA